MAGLVAFACSADARAQISLSTAVNLALSTSPRVRLAQTDVTRTQAAVSESKDVFVPAISTNAGVGKEVGAPLSPPVVFTIGAQSLVFNFSQFDYVRAARAAVASAQRALDAVRIDVAEDTVNTYVSLDNAQRRRAVQAEAFAVATRLSEIVQDRFTAGVDAHMEVTKARRAAAQIQLGELQVDDEIAADQEHLRILTGLPASGWKTVPDSIPPLSLPPAPRETADTNLNLYAGTSPAFATAVSKRYTARGDERQLFRPQVSFAANYSRLEDAFTSYDQYYPSFPGTAGHPNSFNSLSVGVQLTLPLLDMVRRAKARESAADAAHSLLEAQVQQATFIEGRDKLRHNAAELVARANLAELDHDLAKDELDAVVLRLQAVSAGASGSQTNPKDEQNARLAERQRTLDMLNAELQLQQTEVTLMRQEGSLGRYLELALDGTSDGQPGCSGARRHLSCVANHVGHRARGGVTCGCSDSTRSRTHHRLHALHPAVGAGHHTAVGPTLHFSGQSASLNDPNRRVRVLPGAPPVAPRPVQAP